MIPIQRSCRSPKAMRSYTVFLKVPPRWHAANAWLACSDDIGRVVQFRSDALRERRREYNVEYRLIRPGGEWRWVETRCFVSYSSEGRPHRVIGVCIDINERKRVEEQQKVLLAELDHRVKNTLATVSAVVAHTLDDSDLMQNCAMALNGR